MFGVALAVADGEPVTSAAEREGLGAGDRVAVMLAGAPHEMSATASSSRSIVGR